MYDRPFGEEELERGVDSWRRKRKRARGVRYGGEGSDEPRRVQDGLKVCRPHKVRGRWTIYVRKVEEVIVQKDHTGHETKAAIVQCEDQDDGDNERLPYPEARLRVFPRGPEMEIHGQLVLEQDVKELEGMEMWFR